MKRTACLCSIAFLISVVAFLGLVGSVEARCTEVEDWSEPNGYAYAYVGGCYQRIGKPYYRVHHKARIYECLKGRCHFIGWDQSGDPIYNIIEYLGVGMGEPAQKDYYSPYNVVWTAQTETWAPYAPHPPPNMEYASAFLLPPGML